MYMNIRIQLQTLVKLLYTSKPATVGYSPQPYILLQRSVARNLYSPCRRKQQLPWTKTDQQRSGYLELEMLWGTRRM